MYHQAMKYHWLHRPAITALLASDLIFNARLTRLLEPLPLQALILGGVTLLICFYLVIAFLRFHFVLVLLELAIIFAIYQQMLFFQSKTGVPPDFNAFFQYIWVLTLVIFVVAVRDGLIEFIVRRLLLFSTIYAAVYILLALAYQVGALPQSIAAGIVSDNDERGARLFCYALAVNFAWFAWMVRFSMRPSQKAFLGMAICFIASALAISRVSLLLMFVLTILYLVGMRARAIKWISIAIFCIITLPGLYGLIDQEWNPYSLFASDASGGYRMLEYEVARVYIWNDPVFAFGIPPAFKGAASLLLKFEVFGADLGAVGIWFNYGLFGIALFILGTLLSCRLQTGLPAYLRHPLFLTGCFVTAYAGLAPLSVSGGATIVAIVIANALYGRRQQPQPLKLRYQVAGAPGPLTEAA